MLFSSAVQMIQFFVFGGDKALAVHEVFRFIANHIIELAVIERLSWL